jgi:hypothetical protein
MLCPELIHGSVSLLVTWLADTDVIYLGCTVSIGTRFVKLCRLIWCFRYLLLDVCNIP